MPNATPHAVRQLARLGVGILALVVFTGCSPVVDGRTGITREPDGRLLGLAKACKGKFDGAGMYRDDDPSSTSVPVRMARWERDKSTGDLLTWRLQDSNRVEWTTGEPLATNALEAGHVYVLDAWGEDQEWSADELRFTLGDLENVTTDTVLIARTDPKSGASHPVNIPRGDFEASACQS